VTAKICNLSMYAYFLAFNIKQQDLVQLYGLPVWAACSLLFIHLLNMPDDSTFNCTVQYNERYNAKT